MSTIEITRVDDLREGDFVTLRWEFVDGATVTLEGPMWNRMVGAYAVTDARFVSATREVPDDIEALRQDLAWCKEAAMVHERYAQVCRAEAEQMRLEVAKYREEAERLRAARQVPTRKQIVDAMWPDAPESARVGMTDLGAVDRVVALFKQGGES